MVKTMTSRERVLAALRREPVDYVPCVCGFNPLSAVQRKGRTWNFPWRPEASSGSMGCPSRKRGQKSVQKRH